MEFRTKVALEPVKGVLNYTDSILTLGSCFADNIGERLLHAGMQVMCNPFGTLYNPCSIATSLERMISGEHFREDDLTERDGLWHSFSHHGRFSMADKLVTLQGINLALDEAREKLMHCDVLMLTLGTAWVYERNGYVVANCHKFPDKEFIRRCMSVGEVADVLEKILSHLKSLCPTLKVVVTVSPIRHFRDGAHGNQLSKSTLLLGVQELCERVQDVYYFPAYEIMMDDLRDYRFYADDMLHPSEVAIQYIWEGFITSMMDAETYAKVIEGEQQYRASAHRRLH